MVYIWRNSGRHFMPCRCCIVEILDGNSGFASLRRVCFAGAAHSPYGSLFPAKSDGEETAETADALGGAERMITTMELLGKGTQNPVEEMAVADGFAKAKETDFAEALSDAPACEGAACPCVGGGAYHWCWIYAGAAG